MEDTYSNIAKKNTFSGWEELKPKIIKEFRAYHRNKNIPLKSSAITNNTTQHSLFEETNSEKEEVSKSNKTTTTFNFEERNGAVCSILITESGERIISPIFNGEKTGIQLKIHEIEEYSNKIGIFPSGQNVKIEEIIIGIEHNELKYIKKISSPENSDKITATFYFENDAPARYKTNPPAKPSLIDGKYMIKSDKQRWTEDKFVGEHVARYFKAFIEQHNPVKESLENCLEYLKLENEIKLRKFGGQDKPKTQTEIKNPSLDIKHGKVYR